LPRKEGRDSAIFGMITLAFAVLFVPGVEAASCRGYPQGVRAAINKQVEVLRALEPETTDRLKGLDTPVRLSPDPGARHGPSDCG